MRQLNLFTEIGTSVIIAVVLYWYLFHLCKKYIKFEVAKEKLFWQLLIVFKFVAAFFFAAIHYLKYPYSDTTLYHEFSVYLNEMPSDYVLDKYWIMFNTNGENLYDFLASNGFPISRRENFTQYPLNIIITFNSILNFILFKSFFAKTLLYSAIGFIGLFKLYRLFKIKYPNIHTYYLMMVCFAFPSILFWTSGLLKEPLVVFAVGSILLATYKLSLWGSDKYRQLILLIGGLLICYLFKPYVIILLLLFMFSYLSLSYLYKQPFNKKSILKLSCVFVGVVFGLFLVLNSPLFEDYRIDRVLNTANTLFKNLAKTEVGSSYELPYSPDSLLELISLIPFSFVLVLFRPFIWECHNLMQMMAGGEALLFIAVHLIVLVVILRRKKAYNLFKDPFLVSCAAICTLYFLLISISSANFGTLVRYKILVLPLYLLLLAYQLQGTTQRRVENIER